MAMSTGEQLGTDCVIAVVFDRAHARFFEVTAAGASERTSLQSPATRGGKFHSDRQDSPGAGEHRYHGRLREEERRHRHAIAGELGRLQRQRPHARFVIAGEGEAAEAFRRVLPEPIADRVIGTARLNPLEVTGAIVHATTVKLEAEYARAQEVSLVAAMREGLGTGWAENGIRAVQRALAKGQVRTLLVRADVYPTDLLREVAEEARCQGAGVTVIENRESAEAIDGLAALLRFR